MCHRKNYDDLVEWFTDHQGHDVRGYEAHVVIPQRDTLIYTGERNGEQVLVTVWPGASGAEVAYRTKRTEVWGPPTYLVELP